MDRNEERRKKIEALRKATSSKIKRHLTISSILLIPAIMYPYIAWYSVFMPDGENSGVWFQRSGSVTVVLAVSIEFFLLRVESNINPTNDTPSQVWELGEKYRFWFNAAQVSAITMAVIGTIIWGYGDIFKNT